VHRLLERQLRKCFGQMAEVPEHLRAFLELVDGAYHDFDSDRALLEHSMELVSEELADGFRSCARVKSGSAHWQSARRIRSSCSVKRAR
jgi:two-component system NtrC family sensor kinase